MLRIMLVFPFAAWCCFAQTLVNFGQTMDASLAGETDVYRINAEAGDQILVRLAVLSGELDVHLEIVGLAGNDYCNQVLTTVNPNNPNAPADSVTELKCEIKQSGLVDIKVSGWRGRAHGDYRLFLTRLNSPPGIPRIEYGGKVQGGIDNGLALFRFDGSTGDRVLLRLNRTSGSLSPWLRLYDPEGMVRCEDAREGSLAQISNCPLEKPGTYTLVVGDREQTGTATFDVSITNLNHPLGLDAIALGETKTGRIDDDLDLYRFEVAPSDNIAMRVISDTSGFRPEIQVLGIDGARLCRAIANVNGLGVLENCGFGQGMVYTLLVKARNDIGQGNYRVFLTRLNQPSNARQMTYGQQIEGQIDRSLDLVTFQGSSGDMVDAELLVTSGQMLPEVQLLEPDGTARCVDFNTVGTTARINGCRLGSNGLHTLLVKDADDLNSGGYRLRLESSNAQVDDAPIVTISVPTASDQFTTKRETLEIYGGVFSSFPLLEMTWRSDSGQSGSAMLDTTDNTWRISAVNLLRGENTLTVSARNEAGKEGSDTVRIIYDPPSPFESYLISKFDTDLDGVLNITEVSDVEVINCRNLDLTNIDGVAQFTNLKELQCGENQLTNLPDLQGLRRLEILHCQNNQLTALPSLPSSLKDINCSQNKLGAIQDLSGLAALRIMLASNNRISRVDNLGSWSALKTLDLSYNSLSQLSNLPASLEVLDIVDNQLSALPDLSSARSLKSADFRGNRLTETACVVIQGSTASLIYLNPQNGNRTLECEVDETAPKVTIVAPSDNARLSGQIRADGIIEETGDLQKVIVTTNHNFESDMVTFTPTGELTFDWSFDSIPLAEGENTITITAQDRANNVGVETVTVTSESGETNTAPIVNLSLAGSATEHTLLTFVATATDLDGDALSFGWDFGNGFQPSGCNNYSESIQDGAITAECLYTYSYNFPDEFPVSVFVSDGRKTVEVKGVIEIRRSNRRPVITRPLTADKTETEVGTDILFEVEAQDPDGDPLTYRWVMDDGRYFETDGGVLRYSYNQPDRYEVKVRAVDGDDVDLSAISIKINPAPHPAIGLGNLKAVVTPEGISASKMTVVLTNVGLGILDYQASLEGIQRPDLNWIHLEGPTQGAIGGADRKNLTINFENSHMLPASASSYKADLVITGQAEVEPVRRTINLWVEPVQSAAKSSANAYGKMTVEWGANGTSDVAHYLINTAAGTGGQFKTGTERQTTATRFSLAGLETDQTYRIKVTPVLKTGGIGEVIELESNTLSLTSFPYLTHFNHVGNPLNFWTGLALLNPGDQDAKILFQAIGQDGLVVATSPIRSLAPGQKLLGLLDRFFDVNVLQAVRLSLFSDRPLSTLELFGGQHTAVMTGIPTDDSVGFTAHVLAGVGAEGFAGVSLVNPSSAAQTRVTVEYFDNQGLRMATRVVTLLPSEKKAFVLNDLINESLHGIPLWVRMTSKRAITGFTIWGDETNEGNNGGAFADSGALSATLPYQDTNSRIYLANPAPANNRVTLCFYKPDGSLAHRETMTLTSMERVVIQGRPEAGSLCAEGSQPLLLGSDYGFKRADGGFLTESLPAVVTPGDQFVVPHVASNAQWRTELLLCNVGSSLVDVEIEGFSEVGDLVSTVSMPLDAFASVRHSIAGLFGEMTRTRIAWLRVKGVAGSKLAGHLWFYGSDEHLPVMGGVPLTRTQ